MINSVISSEIRLAILERTMGFIVANNYSIKMPSNADIEKFKKEALENLQRMYPQAGINAK